MGSTNLNANKISTIELEKLMLKLEKEGEEKTKVLAANYLKADSNKMLEGAKNIINDGEKEFIKKTGRYMHMSEIRRLYG
jgi:hypothetical protein